MALHASANDQAKLLEVADLDVSLARTASQLRGLAKELSIETLEKAMAEMKARRHDAMVGSESIRSELTRAESDVAMVEARIAKDSERLMHTTSAKDAQSLEHELESLHSRRGDLEDIELAVMENLEAAEAILAGIAGELGTVEGALGEAREQEQRQQEDLGGVRRDLEEKRGALVGTLPSDLIELYERQRERYGVGASLLRGRVSRASGVTLTELDIQTLRQTPENEVAMCPTSNAILVRTAESGL
ncbi:MAG: putative nucleic acid-binding Zn-ribbon protein [Pontimonas sp.]|jgi:predicted  nucleic acid-binding Zn-ribbon protein